MRHIIITSAEYAKMLEDPDIQQYKGSQIDLNIPNEEIPAEILQRTKGKGFKVFFPARPDRMYYVCDTAEPPTSKVEFREHGTCNDKPRYDVYGIDPSPEVKEVLLGMIAHSGRQSLKNRWGFWPKETFNHPTLGIVDVGLDGADLRQIGEEVDRLNSTGRISEALDKHFPLEGHGVL